MARTEGTGGGRRRRRTARIALVAAVAGLVAASAALGLPDAQPSVVTIATGLDNPRGVAVGADGAVYVAEAGKAGRRCLGPKRSRICMGFTSAITRIADGSQRRIVGGLISLGGRDGVFATGADGVSVAADGTISFPITGTPECASSKGLPAKARRQLGRLLEWTNGRVRSVADIARLECRKNVDRTDRNSNPYDVLTLADGSRLVVDAGANAVFKVVGHRVSLFAVIPPQVVKGRTIQAVPTSITAGPNGSFFVGEFGGDGLPDGLANVYWIRPNGRVSVFETGFTAITGVSFDAASGDLYVTELVKSSKQFQGGQRDLGGALVRVAPSGAKTELAPGKIVAPGGVAVGPDGSIYVSTFSVFAGRGQVVKVG